jgi:biopolymer transport protein ExbB
MDTAAVWGVSLSRRHHGRQLRYALEDAFGDFDEELLRGKIVIRTIVTVAPLAGLLGTVIGMIETFDSLGEMALFTQSGGIAGGISQALFTTQMGLAVAVPGIIIGRVLDRREQTFRDELDQLKDMLCGERGDLSNA